MARRWPRGFIEVGRMTTAEVLPIASQMAAGLAAAHRAGVVHRDFKTHNVMLVEGSAADPGASGGHDRLRPGTAESPGQRRQVSMSLSESAEISGTPAYMAPEQVEGGEVTPATDVYAFGVVLYKLVTGVCPFVADTPMRTATKRLQEPPPSPRVLVPDIDAQWEATILRCLARQPADRFDHDERPLGRWKARGRAGICTAPAPASAPRPATVAALGRRDRGVVALVVAATGYAWFTAEPSPLASRRSRCCRSKPARPLRSRSICPKASAKPSSGVCPSCRASRWSRTVLRRDHKGQRTDPRDVARALDVAAILAGKVVERAESLTISVELIAGPDRTQLWGGQYVRNAADLMRVPDEISRDVAAKLQVPQATAPIRADGNVRGRPTPGPTNCFQGPLSPREGKYRRSPAGRRVFPPGDRGRSQDMRWRMPDLSDIYRSLINSGQLPRPNICREQGRRPRRRSTWTRALRTAITRSPNLMTYDWEWADAERRYSDRSS